MYSKDAVTMPEALTLLGPAVCGLAAACHWCWYHRITRGRAAADAAVVAVAEEEAADSSDRAYRPAVAFRTPAGESVTAACGGYHDARARPDAVRVGDRVRVLYRADRPSDVILAGRYRAGYVTLAAVAVAWVVVGSLIRAFPSP